MDAIVSRLLKLPHLSFHFPGEPFDKIRGDTFRRTQGVYQMGEV